ncbi:Hypothetical predicted protein [Xyrichtys novacula]|uniref:Uncharacterized protein n=1 Tax=Xyrichtys novacula TaxID=13765 RepID=A0AAV1HNN3_XYRNO|nr:Hypothetical predicted protein [Xyrichtys novacula]
MSAYLMSRNCIVSTMSMSQKKDARKGRNKKKNMVTVPIVKPSADPYANLVPADLYDLDDSEDEFASEATAEDDLDEGDTEGEYKNQKHRIEDTTVNKRREKKSALLIPLASEATAEDNLDEVKKGRLRWSEDDEGNTEAVDDLDEGKILKLAATAIDDLDEGDTEASEATAEDDLDEGKTLKDRGYDCESTERKKKCSPDPASHCGYSRRRSRLGKKNEASAATAEENLDEVKKGRLRLSEDDEGKTLKLAATAIDDLDEGKKLNVSIKNQIHRIEDSTVNQQREKKSALLIRLASAATAEENLDEVKKGRLRLSEDDEGKTLKERGYDCESTERKKKRSPDPASLCGYSRRLSRRGKNTEASAATAEENLDEVKKGRLQLSEDDEGNIEGEYKNQKHRIEDTTVNQRRGKKSALLIQLASEATAVDDLDEGKTLKRGKKNALLIRLASAATAENDLDEGDTEGEYKNQKHRTEDTTVNQRRGKSAILIWLASGYSHRRSRRGKKSEASEATAEDNFDEGDTEAATAVDDLDKGDTEGENKNQKQRIKDSSVNQRRGKSAILIWLASGYSHRRSRRGEKTEGEYKNQLHRIWDTTVNQQRGKKNALLIQLASEATAEDNFDEGDTEGEYKNQKQRIEDTSVSQRRGKEKRSPDTRHQKHRIKDSSVNQRRGKKSALLIRQASEATAENDLDEGDTEAFAATAEDYLDEGKTLKVRIKHQKHSIKDSSVNQRRGKKSALLIRQASEATAENDLDEGDTEGDLCGYSRRLSRRGKNTEGENKTPKTQDRGLDCESTERKKKSALLIRLASAATAEENLDEVKKGRLQLSEDDEGNIEGEYKNQKHRIEDTTVNQRRGKKSALLIQLASEATAVDNLDEGKTEASEATAVDDLDEGDTEGEYKNQKHRTEDMTVNQRRGKSPILIWLASGYSHRRSRRGKKSEAATAVDDLDEGKNTEGEYKNHKHRTEDTTVNQRRGKKSALLIQLASEATGEDDLDEGDTEGEYKNQKQRIKDSSVNQRRGKSAILIWLASGYSYRRSRRGEKTEASPATAENDLDEGDTEGEYKNQKHRIEDTSVNQRRGKSAILIWLASGYSHRRSRRGKKSEAKDDLDEGKNTEGEYKNQKHWIKDTTVNQQRGKSALLIRIASEATAVDDLNEGKTLKATAENNLDEVKKGILRLSEDDEGNTEASAATAGENLDEVKKGRLRLSEDDEGNIEASGYSHRRSRRGNKTECEYKNQKHRIEDSTVNQQKEKKKRSPDPASLCGYSQRESRRSKKGQTAAERGRRGKNTEAFAATAEDYLDEGKTLKVRIKHQKHSIKDSSVKQRRGKSAILIWLASGYIHRRSRRGNKTESSAATAEENLDEVKKGRLQLSEDDEGNIEGEYKNQKHRIEDTTVNQRRGKKSALLIQLASEATAVDNLDEGKTEASAATAEENLDEVKKGRLQLSEDDEGNIEASEATAVDDLDEGDTEGEYKNQKQRIKDTSVNQWRGKSAILIWLASGYSHRRSRRGKKTEGEYKKQLHRIEDSSVNQRRGKEKRSPDLASHWSLCGYSRRESRRSKKGQTAAERGRRGKNTEGEYKNQKHRIEEKALNQRRGKKSALLIQLASEATAEDDLDEGKTLKVTSAATAEENLDEVKKGRLQLSEDDEGNIEGEYKNQKHRIEDTTVNQRRGKKSALLIQLASEATAVDNLDEGKTEASEATAEDNFDEGDTEAATAVDDLDEGDTEGEYKNQKQRIKDSSVNQRRGKSAILIWLASGYSHRRSRRGEKTEASGYSHRRSRRGKKTECEYKNQKHRIEDSTVNQQREKKKRSPDPASLCGYSRRESRRSKKGQTAAERGRRGKNTEGEYKNQKHRIEEKALNQRRGKKSALLIRIASEATAEDDLDEGKTLKVRIKHQKHSIKDSSVNQRRGKKSALLIRQASEATAENDLDEGDIEGEYKNQKHRIEDTTVNQRREKKTALLIPLASEATAEENLDEVKKGRLQLSEDDEGNIEASEATAVDDLDEGDTEGEYKNQKHRTEDTPVNQRRGKSAILIWLASGYSRRRSRGGKKSEAATAVDDLDEGKNTEGEYKNHKHRTEDTTVNQRRGKKSALLIQLASEATGEDDLDEGDTEGEYKNQKQRIKDSSVNQRRGKSAILIWLASGYSHRRSRRGEKTEASPATAENDLDEGDTEGEYKNQKHRIEDTTVNQRRGKSAILIWLASGYSHRRSRRGKKSEAKDDLDEGKNTEGEYKNHKHRIKDSSVNQQRGKKNALLIQQASEATAEDDLDEGKTLKNRGYVCESTEREKKSGILIRRATAATAEDNPMRETLKLAATAIEDLDEGKKLKLAFVVTAKDDLDEGDTEGEYKNQKHRIENTSVNQRRGKSALLIPLASDATAEDDLDEGKTLKDRGYDCESTERKKKRYPDPASLCGYSRRRSRRGKNTEGEYKNQKHRIENTSVNQRRGKSALLIQLASAATAEDDLDEGKTLKDRGYDCESTERKKSALLIRLASAATAEDDLDEGDTEAGENLDEVKKGRLRLSEDDEGNIEGEYKNQKQRIEDTTVNQWRGKKSALLIQLASEATAEDNFDEGKTLKLQEKMISTREIYRRLATAATAEENLDEVKKGRLRLSEDNEGNTEAVDDLDEGDTEDSFRSTGTGSAERRKRKFVCEEKKSALLIG